MVHNFVTQFEPLQNMDEINRWDNRPFSGAWPEPGRDKFTDIQKPIKKKSKRIRTVYTTEQLRALEVIFSETKYVNSELRQEISKALNIGHKSVKIWFQNRRMKEKRESSESSSDSLNEVSSSDMSTPLLPSAELQTFEQVACNVEQVPEPIVYNPDAYQCPMLNFNMNYNYNADNNSPITPNNDVMYNMQYYYNNMYPTQYYPPNYISHFNDINYNQCQTNSMHNYWNFSNIDD